MSSAGMQERKRCIEACRMCKAAKKRCTGDRPCERCVSMGASEQCVFDRGPQQEAFSPRGAILSFPHAQPVPLPNAAAAAALSSSGAQGSLSSSSSSSTSRMFMHPQAHQQHSSMHSSSLIHSHVPQFAGVDSMSASGGPPFRNLPAPLSQNHNGAFLPTTNASTAVAMSPGSVPAGSSADASNVHSMHAWALRQIHDSAAAVAALAHNAHLHSAAAASAANGGPNGSNMMYAHNGRNLLSPNHTSWALHQLQQVYMWLQSLQ